MRTSTRPESTRRLVGGATCVTVTGRRRCRPRSGRCGSRSRRIGPFTPRIVPKHTRRLNGFNEAILSLYAKGLTAGDISAHLANVYDVDVSRELISRVPDSVLDEMQAWRQRPLDRSIRWCSSTPS
nr:transposase [Micromonospora sp. ATCC 39149]